MWRESEKFLQGELWKNTWAYWSGNKWRHHYHYHHLFSFVESFPALHLIIWCVRSNDDDDVRGNDDDVRGNDDSQMNKTSIDGDKHGDTKWWWWCSRWQVPSCSLCVKSWKRKFETKVLLFSDNMNNNSAHTFLQFPLWLSIHSSIHLPIHIYASTYLFIHPSTYPHIN